MRSLRLAVAILVLGAGAARADFAGWSKAGDFWANDAGEEVSFCATDPDTPPKWSLPAPESGITGEACVFTGKGNDQPVPKDWKAWVTLPPLLAKLPAGLTVKQVKGPSSFAALAFTVNKLTAKCSFYVESDVPKYTVGGLWLSPRGDALTVKLKSKQGDSWQQCYLPTLKAGLGSRGGAGGAPAGDRKAATAANAKGMKAYKKHVWLDAIAAFKEAVAADPSYVAAHYDLASVASITGDLPTVRAELGWMSKSSDQDAARLLNKAMMDPDLDAASTDPEVRKLINAPDWAGVSLHDNLTERTGVWSAEGVECSAPAFSFKFDDRGTFTGTAALICKGKKQSQRIKGTWAIDGDKVMLKSAKAKSGANLDGAALSPAKCKGSSVAGSCLSVAGADQLLHRGVPEVTAGFKY